MFSAGVIFIKSFSQNFKNIKCPYINEQHSRDNGRPIPQTYQGSKNQKPYFRVWESHNWAKFTKNQHKKFCRPIQNSTTKTSFHRIYLIYSRTFPESFSHVLYSGAGLQLLEHVPGPYISASKREKMWLHESILEKNIDFQEKVFWQQLII